MKYLFPTRRQKKKKKKHLQLAKRTYFDEFKIFCVAGNFAEICQHWLMIFPLTQMSYCIKRLKTSC